MGIDTSSQKVFCAHRQDPKIEILKIVSSARPEQALLEPQSRQVKWRHSQPFLLASTDIG